MPKENPATAAGHTPASAADRDRQLIARFRQGEETAFDELFRLYFEPIRDYLRQHTDDTQAAEDAAQVAFIHAYGALGRDDRDVHFQGWMRRIARNALVDVWRWSQRQKRAAEEAGFEEEDLSEQNLASEHPAASQPHLVAERQETVERFWVVAATLPRDQYHMLLLRLKYGRSSKEAGVILDKEPAAVDVLFQEAKRSLPEAGYAALAKAVPNLVPCLRLRVLVVAFQPGPLTGDERKRINRHVRNCPACQEHRQSLDWADLFAPHHPGTDVLSCQDGVMYWIDLATGNGLASGSESRRRRHLPLPRWPTKIPHALGPPFRSVDSLPAPLTRAPAGFPDQFSSKGLDHPSF